MPIFRSSLPRKWVLRNVLSKTRMLLVMLHGDFLSPCRSRTLSRARWARGGPLMWQAVRRALWGHPWWGCACSEFVLGILVPELQDQWPWFFWNHLAEGTPLTDDESLETGSTSGGPASHGSCCLYTGHLLPAGHKFAWCSPGLGCRSLVAASSRRRSSGLQWRQK